MNDVLTDGELDNGINPGGLKGVRIDGPAPGILQWIAIQILRTRAVQGDAGLPTHRHHNCLILTRMRSRSMSGIQHSDEHVTRFRIEDAVKNHELNEMLAYGQLRKRARLARALGCSRAWVTKVLRGLPENRSI